jgi:hypothetical protein
MMSLTYLPLSFWGYALEIAAFTLNRAPSKSVETTPYELWFGAKPKLSFLKVWGCEAYVKKLMPDKLKPKAEKCVMTRKISLIDNCLLFAFRVTVASCIIMHTSPCFFFVKSKIIWYKTISKFCSYGFIMTPPLLFLFRLHTSQTKYRQKFNNCF